MKKSSHRRHDISDHLWALLEPHLPGRKVSWGGVARDNCRFINAVLWMMRTGLPRRHLPADYGDWSSIHRRFIRWRNKGIWERLMGIFIDEPDDEWLMIDASHCKIHPHAAGAKGDNQDMERTKGLNTKLHLAVDMHGMPVRAVMTEGRAADCQEASRLIEGLSAGHLLADRGYDTNAILAQASAQGMAPVIALSSLMV